MTEQLETSIRLPAFLTVFSVVAFCEILRPRRKLSAGKGWRWVSNLALSALNTVATRVVLPVTAVQSARLAVESGWGLFSWLAWPAWLETLLAVVVLDLAIYLQHVLFHAVPALWRLHLMHHADLDFDVTTGLRFHTLEMLLSAVIKIGVVAALGPSVIAVVIFEVLLNATALFNHSNVELPGSVDRWLRRLVVTPDMHRVHHSTNHRETSSNFGFNLPWWDVLFGTYLAQPALGHTSMRIGVDGLQDERQVDRLPGMLALPFQALPDQYSTCGPQRPG